MMRMMSTLLPPISKKFIQFIMFYSVDLYQCGISSLSFCQINCSQIAHLEEKKDCIQDLIVVNMCTHACMFLHSRSHKSAHHPMDNNHERNKSQDVYSWQNN